MHKPIVRYLGIAANLQILDTAGYTSGMFQCVNIASAAETVTHTLIGGGLSIGVAFAAGIISFLSPCVLPLVPGLIAYLAGTGINDKRVHSKLMQTVFFVIGFLVVFCVIGFLLHIFLGSVTLDVSKLFNRLGGAMVIFFGLMLLGILNFGFLDRQHMFSIRSKRGSMITSLLFGSAFALGWTPCVGAALGAIFGLALASPGYSFLMLLSYGLGLALPFLLVGYFTDRGERLIAEHITDLANISKIFGVMLIILGILMFTQSLGFISVLDPLKIIVK